MTQVAKMILNELPISPTINEKIEFIKSSKLDFKDFNSFRLLLNSLEGFEPSSKLSPNEYKAQINRRIGAFLERLNVLEEKIKNTQNLEIEQESKPNEALSKDDNREDSLSDRAKYFYLLAEIETFANKEEQDSQTLGKLLEKTSELLLNAENLNDDEIDTLEETKESLQEYFIHLKQNEERKESSNVLSRNENEKLQILESQSDDTMENVSNESQKDLPQNNINPQDSNPQPTIQTSLFDDEEVKPQKKRMS
ncbi:hypothetical protein NCR96_08965 [Helicobacter sp. 14348-15]|uniref:hypothetical protein n=1 Tax=Helicobacter colisuis TaxID=2949739 RepID=UPI00202B556C|nr:hypothetical protein [Helicobacter colisuis]MCL9821863.1 hypothetical protein [Helicobacter colisuis]